MSEAFALTRDGRLLFSARIARLYAYGFLSIVLVLYLAQAGLTEAQVGVLLTMTLIGDTLISLWLTSHADRIGRRRTLVVGAGLMTLAGVLFVLTQDFVLLAAAATIGVISPSGYEVGPFLPVEQAALAHIIPNTHRTRVFAWYNLAGSFATALGALGGGALTQVLRQSAGLPALESYRVILLGYAAIGLLLAVLFTRLSPGIEATAAEHPSPRARYQPRLVRRKHPSVSNLRPLTSNLPSRGLRHSRRTVLKLSALFALDAFAGGFVVQSIVVYWFHVRFGIEAAALGGMIFGANVLAGLSGLFAARLAARFGLINTMVFSHVPSNVLLMLVPLMPTLPLAIALLLVRFSISQMDVPTRQSYTMAVVEPDERSAAAGVTGTARTIGAALSPALTGL